MLSSEQESAWVDWYYIEFYDELERLTSEGYRWVYVAAAGTDLSRLEVQHVRITGEFPGGDVVVTKRIVWPHMAAELGLDAILPATKRAAAKLRIIDYYNARPDAPFAVLNQKYQWAALIHHSTRAGVEWQGSKFDVDGPYGHVEGETLEQVLDQLIEDGFTEPREDAIDEVM